MCRGATQGTFWPCSGVVSPSEGELTLPPDARSHSCQLVPTPAFVGQHHQAPLALNLVETHRQELLKAHRLLDDAEDRLHRLLTESVTGALFRPSQLLAHGCNPVRWDLPRQRRCLRRTEVVSPPFSRRSHRHLHAAVLQLPDLAAGGVAVVRQHTRCRTHRRRDCIHICDQLNLPPFRPDHLA